MPLATLEQELKLKEARHALEDRLPDDAGRYTLIHVDGLAGTNGAGVAYSLQDKTMLVLLDDTARNHAPDYPPFFLLDTARELTQFFQTLVVPAQSSHGRTYAAGKKRGPFVVYQFALPDSPDYLRF